MPYKDINKQREASRERQRRYKAKQKGVTSEGVTEKALLKSHTDEIYRQGAALLDTTHERFIAAGGKDNYLARVTAAQLYSAIRSYPQDTWVNSPEHVELMRRLKTMSVEQLEAEGYWIPCWKQAEAA